VLRGFPVCSGSISELTEGFFVESLIHSILSCLPLTASSSQSISNKRIVSLFGQRRGLRRAAKPQSSGARLWLVCFMSCKLLRAGNVIIRVCVSAFVSMC